MVEIKLSQGAKPGHGGVLPAPKVSREISPTRGVPMGEDCVSPARHSAFSTPIEMMRFIAEMRRLSGGKPAGFKLCIGHAWEFLAICKAMLETGIYPDFIVVDGKEGGTGAAPLEFIDHIGMPMREGLCFVHNALVGIGVRDRIKLGASRQDHHRLRHRARHGARRRLVQRRARLHVRARLHPVAELPHRPLPDRRRHAGPARASARWSCRTRAQRVANFHGATLHALAELTAAAGLEHPNEFTPRHISRRISPSEVATFADLYPTLRERRAARRHRQSALAQPWNMANAHSFRAVG